MDRDRFRAEMKSGVRLLNQDENEAIVNHVRRWLAGRLPGTVSAYLALVDEVRLEPLFDHLSGWRWVLPRVGGDKKMSFHDRAGPIETHPFGMRQPAASSPIGIDEIDVFLVPGLAFDSAGGRMGRGGGFYDKTLALARTDAVRVGICPSFCLVEEVPMAAHDLSMNWLVTRDGVSRCLPRE